MRAMGAPIDLGRFEKDLVVHRYITIIGKRAVPFTLCGFELYLPGKNTPAQLLPDPADPYAPAVYTFSAYDTSRYEKKEMIFQSGKTLRRGQLLEGYLLAIDPDPIPAEIRHRTNATAKLTIFDQFDAAHSSDLILTVDRSAEWGPKPVAPQPRITLFDQSDRKMSKLCSDAAEMVTTWG
jgi:hypothetical protein